MLERTLQQVLEKSFSSSRKEDWIKIATQEIHGKNPLESLAWHGKDQILYLPYYDAQDAADEPEFSVALGSAKEFRHWANLPLVKIADDLADIAAEAYTGGVLDGLCVDLRGAAAAQLNQLPDHLAPPYRTMAFVCGSLDDLPPHFATTIAPRKESVTTVLFWEKVPKNNPLKSFPGAYTGFVVSPSSPAEEISHALLTGVRLFEGFRDATHEKNLFKAIAFSLPTDAVLVETIAKFRALRLLWHGVAHAYGLIDYKAADLWIHARSSAVGDGAYGPHENMLKATFSAMAAVSGGCNGLTVECDASSPLAVRQARNISLILREESSFDRVVDPFAGSFALEAVTRAIAAKAWALFQEKWKRS